MTRRAPVRIRGMRVGDLGWTFFRQSLVYREEFGYSDVFEEYLAEGLSPFLKHYDPQKDRLWVAEFAGRTVGFIAVHHVAERPGWARLRWFLVEKEHRRRGIGTRLMRTAVSFCKRSGYAGIYLWTVDDLDAARRVYERAGFFLAKQKNDCAWIRENHEQRWDLKLRRRFQAMR